MASEVNIVVSATDRASGVLRGITNTLGAIAATAAGIAVASGVAFVALGKQALDATAEWERMGLSMESLVARELRAADSTLTMSEALEQASGESERLLGWIQDLAIHSPFDVAGVQLAYRQALTYGFASDEAQRLTQNLVDFAAANGLSTDAMNTASYALGQINNADKVLMLDLRQLMQVGAPVRETLEAMGMSFEDVSDGAIQSAEFIEAFNQVVEDMFTGAAARQTNTWTGLLNTFGDLRKMALRELFAGIFDVLQPLVSKFAEWLQGPGLEKLKEWGVALGDMTRNLLDFIGSLSGQGFEDLANLAADFWVNFTADLLDQARSVDWSGLSQALADKISEIDWNLLGQKLGAGIRNAFAVISEIASEIDWGALFSATLSAAAEFFVGIFGHTMDEAKRILRDTLNSAKNDMTVFFQGIANSIPAALASTMPILAAIGSAAGRALMANLAAAIRGALGTVLSAVNAVVSAISNAVGGMNLPGLGGGNNSRPSSGSTGSRGGPNQPRARGGPVNPYGMYTVGEEGPETLVMGSRGGTIIPNGGVTVNVKLTSFLSLADQADMEAKLVPVINRAIRSARGVV